MAAGAMTTGGTESIFLAVKTARDWARKHRPEIRDPEIVAAVFGAHLPFNKAAHFMGLRVKRVPITKDFLADPAAMEAALNQGYGDDGGVGAGLPARRRRPDPGASARSQSARACGCMSTPVWGGYFVPFARKLGVPIPAFDFSVPGVRSMSADLHKYGYTAKGASSVLYRDRESFSFQAYEFEEWSRGKYSTQSLVGTRAGGAIAAAWAVMNYLGEDGYLRVTKRVLATRAAIEAGVRKLGFEVWGKPQLSILTYGSHSEDIYAVADRMTEKGWFVGASPSRAASTSC
jgi:glutamate/tyrosine decarboxylase-like PLP-dependent enzyme